MYDRKEKRDHRRRVANERATKLHRDEFIKAAMQHKQGREYVYWILSLCGVGRNPFTANALTTSFACGELNVGQQIQNHLIEVAPNLFLEMLREKEEERLNDRRSDDSDSAADGNDDNAGDGFSD
jgi:hypothetical protein